ncbi:LANO_0G17326g1_1 [Lachancea nothofagi CBS 11611]|uniref:LANO_0G17326g1_1 n=1 Tax=Lachancea nothofagi CBS 11611 TaxID=1266666 RepID=A0A1G4KKF6_9SACH|nr:LANO_0G17326g1_1 [Lachancea nothofagi CBS 11611]
MSSLEVRKESGSSQTETKPESSEQVVTVFDLATEIEQSLQKVMKDIEGNDQEFQEQYKAIERRLRSLER